MSFFDLVELIKVFGLCWIIGWQLFCGNLLEFNNFVVDLSQSLVVEEKEYDGQCSVCGD